MKKLGCWLLLTSFVFMLTGCGTSGGISPGEKVKVVATVYPVYEFAKRIGGDKIDLVLMTPAGAEPHDWEPTAKDLVKIREAKLFLYQGNGLEPWVDKLLTQNKTTFSVAASHDIEVLPGIPEEDEDDKSHKTAAAAMPDPHIWLDPVLAAQEAVNICEALVSVDPENESLYRSNTEKLKADLGVLDSEYSQALQGLSRKDVVTTHAAFAYLVKRYGLNQVPLMGLAPDAEPTPEKLAQVADFCRQNKVRVVFFETLVSPKLAEMIGKGTGAATLVLNPLEGLTDSDSKAGKNYFTIMRENLANIKTALQ